MRRTPATATTGRRGTVAAASVLGVSLAVLVATPVVVLADRGADSTPASVGDRRAVAASTGLRADAATAGPAARVAATGPRPAAVIVPSLDLSTSVIPAGVTSGGAVAVPDDIALVGWYRFGARPADGRGSTVLVGHRDGVLEGAGAFFGLDTLRPGDRVELVDTSWERTGYRVVAREAFSKKAVPYDELFATTGPERLTLISCGGRFLREEGSYEDNVVVTAVPDREASR